MRRQLIAHGIAIGNLAAETAELKWEVISLVEALMRIIKQKKPTQEKSKEST